MSDRLLIVILAFTGFVGALTHLALTPMLGAISDDLDVSIALIGQAVTVTYISGATLGLIAGPIGDHLGHRRLLMIGGVISVMSLFATALAPTYSLLLLSRIPGGLGGALLPAMAFVIASTRLPEGKRRSGIGWIFTAFAMAPIIGFPMLTEVGERVDWRWSMVVLGTVIMLAIPFVWRAVGPDGPRPNTRFGVRETLQAYGPILRDSRALLLQACNFLRTLAAFGVVTYLGAYLMEEHGLSLAQVGYVYVVTGLGYFIGTRLGDGRYVPISFRSYQSLTAGLFGVAFAAPFVFSLGPIATTLVLAAGSIAMSAGFVSLTILISEETPGGAATALMLRQSGFSYGTAAAGAIGGVLIATAGFEAFGVATLLIALLSAVAGQWSPGHREKTAPATQ